MPDNACVNKNLESQLEYISKFENSIFVLATRWEHHINFYDSLDYDIYNDINDTLSFLLERNNKIIIISAIPIQNIKVVDNCLDLMGPLEVDSETRQELVEHANTEGEMNWNSDSSSDSANERISEMLQLISSLRDYQYA